jgi:hypothetical protein
VQGASEEVAATVLEGWADAAEPDAHNRPQSEALDAFPQSPCWWAAGEDALQSPIAGTAIAFAGTPRTNAKPIRITKCIYWTSSLLRGCSPGFGLLPMNSIGITQQAMRTARMMRVVVSIGSSAFRRFLADHEPLRRNEAVRRYYEIRRRRRTLEHSSG